MKEYEIKFRPNKGDFAIMQGKKVVRDAPTMQDANNILNNLRVNEPSTEVGFGKWGIPEFMERKFG